MPDRSTSVWQAPCLTNRRKTKEGVRKVGGWVVVARGVVREKEEGMIEE